MPIPDNQACARTATHKRTTTTITPDGMDRHPSGSRQDTHGTLGPVRGQAVGGSSHVHRARHQVYLHNMVAERDTTHWCQKGRPTRGLSGDAPRTVTSETLVACGEHVETRRTSQETSGSRRRPAQTVQLTALRNVSQVRPSATPCSK